MKLKTILAASLLVSGFAFADSTEIETSYVLGVMPLNLVEGQTEAIIGVPWIEPGQTDEGIAVSNIVKTANLNTGDMLYWYDTSTTSWKMWYLSNGYWQSVATDGEGEALGSFKKTDASARTLKRGEAFLLKRSSGTTPATSIYVVGQYESSATTINIPTGETTLIAPPRTIEVDLNTATWGNVGAGDSIVIRAGNGGLLKTFIYKDSKWGYETSTLGDPVTFHDTAVVPVGCGAFYISTAAKGSNTTMRWPEL